MNPYLHGVCVGIGAFIVGFVVQVEIDGLWGVFLSFPCVFMVLEMFSPSST